jgi:tetratricopeptide (TPR) repeat protein
MGFRAIRLCLIIAVSWLALAGFGVHAQMNDTERKVALALEFQKLRSAQHPAAASVAEQEIWRLWFIGPNEDITEKLNAASEALRYGDYAAAEVRLTELILKAPNHAEIWNQRAFARFLQLRFEDSLKDIERALALEPRHFGALAGRARIEAQLGHPDDASKTMGEVGVIHPWMARMGPIPADPPPPEPIQQQDL